MDGLIAKLEEFTLEKFIHTHRHPLCKKTVNQEKIAAFLRMDADQIAIVMQPPDNFWRCCKLYEYIEKTTTASRFLQSLEETNNGHVVEFIQSVFVASPISRRNPVVKCGIWFNIPEPIESFCGRKDFLTQLHDKLQGQDVPTSMSEVTVLSQVKIVSGLGGIGKTQTSRRYISQYFECYNNFIWIDAENDNSMINSFINLANVLQIPAKSPGGKSREIEEIVKEIYNKICSSGTFNLIVFDNAEDYKSGQKFFPFGLHPSLKKPAILATSRNQDWISPTGKIQVVPLDMLTDDESLEFILKELDILDPNSPEFREESKEFIKMIGGLPLALQQAVAFIKQEKKLKELLKKSYNIKDYVQEFKSSMKKFQSHYQFSSSSALSSTVFVTSIMTCKKVKELENGENAIKILEFLSFLYADKIPLSFLRDLVPEIKHGEFSGALKLLEKYSLIKMDGSSFYLSLHRQLQFVVLQYLKELNEISKVVTNLVEKCGVALKNIKLPKSDDIFLSVHQIVNNQFNLIPKDEKFLDFMYQFGATLFDASRYSESLELYKKVYSKYRDLLGENHVKTLNSQHMTALNLSPLGKYDEALTLFTEILKSEENNPDLGVDHPSTISTKYNMASVLQQQGKYDESLEFFQQVLDQRAKILGENHPETLLTQNAIALARSSLGDSSKALALHEELEKKQIEILGPDHKDVTYTKHNKAWVLYEMGKTKEASRIFNDVYEKRKEILGENHLDTINTLDWIGTTLDKEGKLKEALEIYKKVYEIRKTNLGENHRDTINVKARIVNVERRLQQ